MPTAVIAALLGAAVGFAGTYLIQRGHWRRQELEHLRMRLGVIRSLSIDLGAAALSVESSQTNSVIAQGTRYPTTTWFTHGHLVLGVLKPQAVTPLMEAFGRFDVVNSYLAALGEIKLKGSAAQEFNLPLMRQRIREALEVLERLEAETDAKREAVQHPWRSCLSRLSERHRDAGSSASGS
jgi:hypothetical protein